MKFHRRRVRVRGAEYGPKAAVWALRTVLQKNGIAREVREHRLITQWEKIVGSRVASRTTPDGLDKGVLWVRVDSSAWMHELSFLRADIVKKANEICEQEVLKDVRFHLGRRNPKSTDPVSAAARIRRAPLKERPLPPPARGAHLAAIEQDAAGIEDDELRRAIIEVRTKLAL